MKTNNTAFFVSINIDANANEKHEAKQKVHEYPTLTLSWITRSVSRTYTH